MRYINIADLKTSDDWEEKAREVMDELFEASDSNERKEIIQKRSKLWSELKRALGDLSDGKCWYCESEQDRSDNTVDHFRPKGKVAECDEHEGYWWLAFDWRNYRFSCTFCNSHRVDTVKGDDGGKQDHFPLIDEANRAKQSNDYLEIELPCLLDPTNPNDPGLLWYDYSEGRAVPKFAEDEDSTKHKRAKVSICLYHLNHTNLEEKRKILYKEIVDLVNIGSSSLSQMSEYGNTDPKVYNYAKDNMTFVLRKLHFLLSPKAELSSVTRTFLETLAISDQDGRYSWVKKTLLS